MRRDLYKNGTVSWEQLPETEKEYVRQYNPALSEEYLKKEKYCLTNKGKIDRRSSPFA